MPTFFGSQAVAVPLHRRHLFDWIETAIEVFAEMWEFNKGNIARYFLYLENNNA